MIGQDVIADFHCLQIAWLMQFNDGWWACFNDERPLGPFASEGEAARAGLQAWAKANNA